MDSQDLGFGEAFGDFRQPEGMGGFEGIGANVESQNYTSFCDLFDQRERHVFAVDIESVLSTVQLDAIETVFLHAAFDLVFGSFQPKMGIRPSESQNSIGVFCQNQHPGNMQAAARSVLYQHLNISFGGSPHQPGYPNPFLQV
jgi:hypothetical protein